MTDEEAAAEAALLESVRNGHLEIVGLDETGAPVFTMTDAGRAYVESLIGIAPTDVAPKETP